MAYTTINKGSDYFNTKLYTGNGTAGHAITGVGFQPDWVWIKNRDVVVNHIVVDIVRGSGNFVNTNLNSAETSGTVLASFDTDGFTIDATGSGTNSSEDNFVAWNWLAAGTAPSKTYAVTVVSDSGNKYRFDGYGTSAVTLELSEGGTFRFDQSDSSNSGHPLRFSTTSDGTHGGGSEYTTGVTTVGTPGTSGAYTEITVAASAPTLYYYCSVHSGMGGQANTPTTNSFSSFDGSIQSNISPNTTSGFSIVSFTGTGSDATVGHGLNVAPDMVIVKSRDAVRNWPVYHRSLGGDDSLKLNLTDATTTTLDCWNDLDPTSTVVHLGTTGGSNVNGEDFIAYCFHSVKGYSKFDSYTGNGSTDGTFVYTGFKPAFIITKGTGNVSSWNITDVTRSTYNDGSLERFKANESDAETSTSNFDILSNGFKLRTTDNDYNGSGNNYIYMAFAENPLVTSGGTPVTAR